MTLNDVLSNDDKFKYQLLARLQEDCKYYLGNGARNIKHLWADDEAQHIMFMKEIWNSFSDDQKPEWLSFEEIIQFEKELIK